MPAPVIHFDDPLPRQVLLAVELHDPLAPGLVWRGVEVKAEGLSGKPIISRSGRFVWLREGDAWPTRITVNTGRLPFVLPPAVQPPRPADLAKPKEDEQRVRIVLHPSPAYGFGPGATVVWGSLREHLDPDAAQVPDAVVSLAWRDAATPGWVKVLPPAVTDAAGEFAVFLRLQALPPARPDLAEGGLLRVRLAVTRGAEQRRTGDDFRFDADPSVPAGRLREGFPLAQPLRLGWQKLVP